MNPTILGVIGPGFLNQVPTLHFKAKALNLERKAYPQLKPDPVILTPEPDASNALPTE